MLYNIDDAHWKRPAKQPLLSEETTFLLDFARTIECTPFGSLGLFSDYRFFFMLTFLGQICKRNFISWGNKLPPRLCKNYIMYYFCLSGVVLWLLFFVHINITDQVGPIIISAPSSFPVYLECLQFLWSDSPCLYTFDNGITCFIITFICKPRLSYPCCYRGHLKLPKKLLFLFLVYFIQFSLAQPDRPCSALVDMPLLYGIKHLVPIISHLEYSVQICLLVLFDPS